MNLADLIKSNNWLSVEMTLLELYPDQEEMLEEYNLVYEQLKMMETADSDLSIVLTECEENWEGEEASDSYIDVSGVKMGDTNAGPERYAIEFQEWKEWLGMEIAQETLENFSALDIISHCLYEMTFVSFDEAEIKERMNEMKASIEELKNMSEEEKSKRTYTLDDIERLFGEDDDIE